MSTWEDLKTLRDAGMAPAHKLFVFPPGKRHWRFRQAMLDIGAMVIDHKPGERVPTEILGGLELMFMVDNCVDMPKIERAQSAYQPRIRAWCQCSKDFTIIPGACS